MKFLLGSLVFVVALPVVLLIAVALGPVTVGILCAIGFALIVLAIVNGVLGLGLGAERAGSRLVRRGHRP